MRSILARHALLLPLVLTGGYVIVDAIVESRTGRGFFWPHLVIAAAVMLLAAAAMMRTAGAARRAEVVAQRARAESEEKYRLLFQNMAEGFALYELIYDEQGQAVDWRALEVNDAYTRHTGISAEQIVGRRLGELFPFAVPEYLPRFATVVSTQTPISFETFAVAVGRHQRVWTFPAGGNRFASTIEDISERKRVEEELRRSEEQFAKVYHFSPDAIGIVNTATGVILDVNSAFCRLLGHARDNAVGAPWEQVGVISREDGAQIAELYAKNGHVIDQELDFITQSGGVATMLVSMIPITVRDEPCVLFIAHDITARKKSEQALRHAQAELARGIEARAALEERQRLARELHDSVSQSLYGVSLGINTALALIDADRANEALEYALSRTRGALAEMRALIFALRPEFLESEGLVVALRKQADSARARFDIEVEADLCDEPRLSIAAKEALYRIAQEAIHNASRHAQPARLDLRLTCGSSGLTLAICDNGVGFDAQAEFPGHLGLKSMRERAQALGGALEIVSAPNCGTQIVVSIPYAADASDPGSDQ